MNRKLTYFFILLISLSGKAQQPTPAANPTTAPTPAIPSVPAQPTTNTTIENQEDDSEKPNGRRIRRQLNLIVGVEHDEEFLIPDREIIFKGAGAAKNFDIKRIKNTDFFRILPKEVSNGIATINDKKTGQVLVELRYDFRDGSVEKQVRELQSLLGDIEGLEYKIVGGKVVIDGYVLLPRDLIRIANVIKQFPEAKSLATLSPVARKKIAEYIARDINNPEVSVTAVGDYIKLEGTVNSEPEKTRVTDIVRLYMPDLVVDKGELDNVNIFGRKNATKLDDLIVNLITVKKDEERSEPPPKMVQVVVHFVQFIESYGKNFRFVFAPSLSAIASNRAPSSTINDTANLISNLLPKLQWAKGHGYARVLDTASLLTQDKKPANYKNNILIKGLIAGQNGAQQENNTSADVSISLTPSIKSERSGLIELGGLSVSVQDVDGGKTTTNTVNTTISVRDRQSAAFAGIIKKKSANEFGGDPGVTDAIVTFQSKKKYDKSSSNFVVFITPIIKSSASAGVDQVKKKFRLRE